MKFLNVNNVKLLNMAEIVIYYFLIIKKGVHDK